MLGAMLIDWKLYLSFLEDKNYLSLTNREIVQKESGKSLARALQHIDEALYAKQRAEVRAYVDALHVLEDVGVKKYMRKKESVLHT